MTHLNLNIELQLGGDFDNDSSTETIIKSTTPEAVVAVAIDFPKAPGVRQENARRIIACWNAFKGIPVEVVEQAQRTDMAKLALHFRDERNSAQDEGDAARTELATARTLLEGTLPMIVQVAGGRALAEQIHIFLKGAGK